MTVIDSRTNKEPESIGAGAVFRLSLWFGLLTGLMEVGARLFQSRVLGERIWLGSDVVWMAPLADVLIFMVIGLVLALLHRLWPRLVTTTVLLTVLLSALVIGPALHLSRIHQLAGLLLAVGVSTQAARMLAPHLPHIRVIARRSAIPMVLLVVAMAVWVRASVALEERRALDALGAPEPGAPNVLFIILDTVRAKSLSLYGYEAPTTPSIDRIAAGGTTFERAWSTSPWTLPSHGTMFTGYYPHELSVSLLTPLDDTYPTLAEAFAERGYLTGGFVANLLYATRWTGLNRGFVHYADYPVSTGMVIASSWLARLLKNGLGRYVKLKSKDAKVVNREFLNWLDGQDQTRPFMIFLNYMDAHAPYLPPAPYNGRFGPKRDGPAMADPSEREHWTQAEIDVERAAYEAMIAYLDAQIGSLFEQLESRDWLDNTIVIIGSDHGEQLGEHGLMDHGNSLYRPLLHVPLVVVWPQRVPAGIRIGTPVSLRDLPSTVATLALGDPGPFPGTPLSEHWSAPGSNRVPGSPVFSEVEEGVRAPDWLPLARGGMRSMVLDGLHYIRNGDGVEELYDIELDPHELVDMAPLPESEVALDSLRAAMESVTSGTASKLGNSVETRSAP